MQQFIFKICSRLFTLEDRMSFEAVPVTAVIPKNSVKRLFGPHYTEGHSNVLMAHQVIFIFSKLDTKHLIVKTHLLLINYPFEITVF